LPIVWAGQNDLKNERKYIMTLYPVAAREGLLSVLDLINMKARGEKIACLTAYDASFGQLVDEAGVDVILVGDSLGMVVQGSSSTLAVSMDDMVYHTRCVVKTNKRALVLADLPFMSCASIDLALHNAARLLRESGAQMVKIEGSKPEIVSALVAEGVPVCGHLGLLPQSINQLGRYAVQGKSVVAADKIIEEAVALEQAGISLLVLECVPSVLTERLSQALSIPIIGIGAGGHCDGQVLVLYDILDISVGKRPRFSKNYMAESSTIQAAVGAFVKEVKAQEFPSLEHGF